MPFNLVVDAIIDGSKRLCSRVCSCVRAEADAEPAPLVPAPADVVVPWSCAPVSAAWARALTVTGSDVVIDVSLLPSGAIDSINLLDAANITSLTVKATYVAKRAHSLVAQVALFNVLDAELAAKLSKLCVNLCCVKSLEPTVKSVASCTALAKLTLTWDWHVDSSVPESNVLAPLSALRKLRCLDMETVGRDSSKRGWPRLPEATQLTHLVVKSLSDFHFLGSDDALKRLRKLELCHPAPRSEMLGVEDPFALRGWSRIDSPWRHRVPKLRELVITLGSGTTAGLNTGYLASIRNVPVGSEWASLTSVTSLTVSSAKYITTHPSTGIVAGLGALPGLRSLSVTTSEPVKEKVRPFSLVSFRDLPTRQLAQLVTLSICSTNPIGRFVNLAELFAGNRELWLKSLTIKNVVVDWDPTGLVGVPAAAEFARTVRASLPVLFHVKIKVTDSVQVTHSVQRVVEAMQRLDPSFVEVGGGG